MQKLKQIPLIKTKGKKIKEVGVSDLSFIILFTDGTFFFFEETDEDDLNRVDEVFINGVYLYELMLRECTLLPSGRVVYSNFATLLLNTGIVSEDILLKDVKEFYENIGKNKNDEEYKLYLKYKEKYEKNEKYENKNIENE